MEIKGKAMHGWGGDRGYRRHLHLPLTFTVNQKLLLKIVFEIDTDITNTENHMQKL